MRPGSQVDLLWVIFAALFITYHYLRIDHSQDGETGHDDAEAARHAYVNGDITEAEMERRLELALDEERQELRRRTEEVSGVGPDTSAALAHEYRTVTELADAPAEEIADRVHGVGESTAEAVHEVVR
jgi:ERCC4-type nuclease